jgi:hypothetical protein
VLPNLYQAVLSRIQGFEGLSPAFGGIEPLNPRRLVPIKRYRCKGSPTHPTTFYNFFMQLVIFVGKKKKPLAYHSGLGETESEI